MYVSVFVVLPTDILLMVMAWSAYFIGMLPTGIVPLLPVGLLPLLPVSLLPLLPVGLLPGCLAARSG